MSSPAYDAELAKPSSVAANPAHAARMHVHANPTIAGLVAVSIPMLILGYVQSGWAEATLLDYLASTNFWFGVITVLVGFWEAVRGTTFWSTAFLALGGFWVSFSFFVYTAKTQGVQPVGGGFSFGAASAGFEEGQGLYFGTFALAATLLLTLTFIGKLPHASKIFFFNMSMTFWLLCGSATDADAGKAAGYFSLLTGLSGVLFAYGALINELVGKHLIPFVSA